ncbi:MAG TPA: matrixin family metalloprotease [Chromatiales bacterium]|nr:matrixin family metalloprotease [Chromatiales bacterium]
MQTLTPHSWLSPRCAALLCLAAAISLWLPPGAQAALVGDASFFAPHHSGSGPKTGENGHYAYFPGAGDGHHFAWGSATPSTPGTITVKYDFRSQNGYANQILSDSAQQNAVLNALNAWSAATGGKLVFVQDTAADSSDIINIGVGDLAAVNASSGVGGVLGFGGGSYLHAGAVHSISSAAVWLDSAETWDTIIGNGDPGGGYDFFTVVAQEIGHVLGLGHSDTVGSIMYDGYGGELTGLAADDILHISSIYGTAAVPLPAGVWLMASGFVSLFLLMRGRNRRPENRRRNTPSTPVAAV